MSLKRLNGDSTQEVVAKLYKQAQEEGKPSHNNTTRLPGSSYRTTSQTVSERVPYTNDIPNIKDRSTRVPQLKRVNPVAPTIPVEILVPEDFIERKARPSLAHLFHEDLRSEQRPKKACSVPLTTDTTSRPHQCTSSTTTYAATPRNCSHITSHTPGEGSNNVDLYKRTTKLLKALGDDVTAVSGDPIDPCIAHIWSKILQEGLNDEVRRNLLGRYNYPENCKLLKAPVLDRDIKSMEPRVATCAGLDKLIEKQQNQLGHGITAIARALMDLINGGDIYEVQAMEQFNHGCRLLLDLHHTQTEMRHSLITKERGRSAVARLMAWIYNSVIATTLC